MYNKELTKGTLLPIILQLISERESMYGYEIAQKVKQITKGKIDISDMSGRVLLATKYKSSPQQQQFSFDTGTMSGGIYYLRIYYDYDVIVKKFLY